MSLYYEAAAVLANSTKAGGSLKSRIYNQKDLKSSPAQIVALVTEASKWSPVLKHVIEQSGLLGEERKLTPTLALLLTHDLIVSRGGVVAPANHVLKLAIGRHKARLSAELTKARIRGGHATLAAFRLALNDGQLDPASEATPRAPKHPRWVRINTRRTTLEEQLSSTFADYEKAESLDQVMRAPGSSRIYFLDPHIPNLLALPSKADLSKTKGYNTGRIIFQDKASCFPAYLLDPKPEDGDIIDGCAAPGNKTTHLAAILTEKTTRDERKDMTQKVIAFERDKMRTLTLEKMVTLAASDNIVSIKGSHDFLEAQPEKFANVGAILLDPSCSGSGIVGRDDALQIHLPDPEVVPTSMAKASKSKKRKRSDKDEKKAKSQPSETLKLELDDTAEEETPDDENSKRAERLASLSAFQLKILTHAMRFPNTRKITYSTCSIHFEENEGVVFKALDSTEAKKFGWTILKRDDQVSGLKQWPRRGVWEDGKLDERANTTDQQKQEVLDGCIRCDKATEDGTMGFFVAGFVREGSVEPDGNGVADEAMDDEWNGFGDEGASALDVKEPTKAAAPASKASKPKKKKRREK